MKYLKTSTIFIVSIFSFIAVNSTFCCALTSLSATDSIGKSSYKINPTTDWKPISNPDINSTHPNKSWSSGWNITGITSNNAPEIGEIYIQNKYDSTTQTVTQKIWEYRPGLSTYITSDEIKIDSNNNSYKIMRDGWVLKEQKIINNVTEVSIEDGKIHNVKINGEKTQLNNISFWDKEFSFNYKYVKSEDENWEALVEIIDKFVSSTIQSLNLVRKEHLDINNVTNLQSLINLMIYTPDKNTREQILNKIKKSGNESAIKVAKNIIDLIYGQNISDRVKAARIIGGYDKKYALTVLKEALGIVKDFEVKSTTIQVIGDIGNREAIEMLVTTLKDIMFGSIAAKELGKIGLPALSPTLEALSGPGWSRLNAVRALGLIGAGSPEVINSLLKLLSSRNWEVRFAVAHSLGKIGKPAINELFNIIDDGNSEHRKMKAAALALGYMGSQIIEPLIKRLSAENSHTRNAAAFALSTIGLPAAKPLIKELGKLPSYKKKKAVIIGLIQMGETAIEPLMQSLDDPNPEIREVASIVLGKIGKPAINPLIDKGLKSKNPIVRKLAADSLVRLGIVAMEEALKEFGFEVPRKPTYEIVREKLIIALESKKEFVRNGAIAILGALGMPVVDQLIEVLKNPDLREGAVEALISVGKPAFISVVKRCLNNNNLEIQKLGERIISEIAENSFNKEALELVVNISDIKNMSNSKLRTLISSSDYPGTRAIAFCYLKNNSTNKRFLENYIFYKDNMSWFKKDEILDKEGMLSVKKNYVSELEMAAILSTEIPLYYNWWYRLSNKEEKINYLRLVLKGDFTDKRRYVQDVEESMIGEGRVWLCVQFATQLKMNFNGYNKENYADKNAFKQYGPGYSIPSIEGYGIPLYYAGTPAGHAFNAVFVGNGKPNSNLKDWILIEPMDDDFSPAVLGEQVSIYIDPFFTPDGHFAGHYPDSKKFIMETEGYLYGANNW